MKKYKDLKSGQILIINNVLINEKLIVINLYDNPIDYKSDKALFRGTIPFNTELNPDIPLNLNDLIEWLVLKTIEEKFAEFEMVETINEWDYENGSTGKPVKVRVFLPNDIIANNIKTETPIGMLLDAMSETIVNFATKGKTGRVQYLEELLPEHETILKEYPSIIIEKKEIIFEP